MNIQYFFWLVSEVLDCKKTLDDVRFILRGNYQKWYDTYYAPVANYKQNQKTIDETLRLQGIVDKNLLNTFNQIKGFLDRDEKRIHGFMNKIPSMSIEDGIEELKNIMTWNNIEESIIFGMVDDTRKSFAYKAATKLQQTKLTSLYTCSKSIFDNSMQYCITVLNEFQDILNDINK